MVYNTYLFGVAVTDVRGTLTATLLTDPLLGGIIFR